MNLRMDCISCLVNRLVCAYNFTLMVHQQQVADSDETEVFTQGIDPEAIEVFRVADGNVSCDTLTKPKVSKQTSGGSKALLAMTAFFLNRSKGRRRKDGLRFF